MTTLARWISVVGHPFVMVALLVGIPALQREPRQAAPLALFVVAAVVAPLAWVMVRQVRRGRWSNVDASAPAERPLLYGTALAGIVVALAGLVLRDPRSFLVRGTLVVALFLVLSALLTRWIKLSLHAAFAALTATALWLIGSPVGYLLAAAVPAIGWSRLVLARHRVHELLVGLLLGIVTGVALVRL